jgi:hypothetical protein
MQLVLERVERNNVCTIGRLSIDGTFECWTLEDMVRDDGVKIPHETAIPAGNYSVDITHSPRFKTDLPLLLNVNGFVGIRIHPGNDASDTDGCILVGQERGDHQILKSRRAFEMLFAKLQAAKNRGEAIAVDIRNA